MKRKSWNEYLWIGELLYLFLGFFNIIFAWLGLIFMFTPLIMAIGGGNKNYCLKYCGKGQLFSVLGSRLKLSYGKRLPKFVASTWFRYGFLTFFMTMFGIMLYSVGLVVAGAELREMVTLLWTFDVPWHWTNVAFVPTWVAQFSFGLYGIMVTSSILGFIGMVAFRPRTFCVFCPMGTMTQGICKLKKEPKEEQ